MSVRLFSGVTVVDMGVGSQSRPCQPSSKASLRKRSKRPSRLLTAPRPCGGGLRFAHCLLFYRSERLAQTIADFTFSGSESPESDILESQLATSLEGRDESASNDEIMPAWCWQIED